MNLAGDSYLVRLGFITDAAQFRQFQLSLKDAAGLVEHHTTSINRSLLKWQVAITGAFAAAGAATLGLADKVAMADQAFRLYGIQMFLGQNQARALKMVLGELGETLDEVAWDPESLMRFRVLMRDNLQMAKELGPAFEQNMFSIRSLRMEYSRFNQEVQFILMKTVSDLFEKLGFGTGDLFHRLDQLNNWIVAHIPEIADWISNKLVPVLKEIWSVMRETWDVVKELGVAFSNLIGILTGDTSLEGTAFSFDKIADSIAHVVGWLKWFVDKMVDAEQVLLHFINAAALLKAGKVGEARQEVAAAVASLSMGSGVFGGSMIGGTAGTMIGGTIGLLTGGPLGAAAGAALGGSVGTAAGAATGFAAGAISQSHRDGADQIADQARRLAQKASAETGVPANVIFSQWAHETNGFLNRGAQQLNNLGGVRYPGTQTYRSFGSLDDFERYYVGLLKSNRYMGAGAAPQNDDDFAAMLKRGSYYEDSLQNYAAGMKRWEPAFNQSSGIAAPTVTTGDIHIRIDKANASPEEIQQAVTDGIAGGGSSIAAQMRTMTLRNMATASQYGRN